MTTSFDPNGSPGYAPEYHDVMPPEVLDPKVLILPNEFNFEKRDVVRGVEPRLPRTAAPQDPWTSRRPAIFIPTTNHSEWVWLHGLPKPLIKVSTAGCQSRLGFCAEVLIF